MNEKKECDCFNCLMKQPIIAEVALAMVTAAKSFDLTAKQGVAAMLKSFMVLAEVLPDSLRLEIATCFMESFMKATTTIVELPTDEREESAHVH